MSKHDDDVNCMNCCIGDFKHGLCDCDGEFCAKFKSIGKADDFIRKVMNACENTCEITRKSNATDLISRQDALEIIDKMKEVYFDRKVILGKVYDQIKDMPTAERKGKWIWSPKDIDGTVSGCCSNCSFSHLFIGGHTAQYNYCPNCGARMVSEE